MTTTEDQGDIVDELGKVRVVAIDVDGTLAGLAHQVSERNIAALRASQDAGLHVILVTGRSRLSTLGIARSAALTTPFIACNGALTVDPVSGEPRRAVYLPHHEVVEFFHAAEAHDLVCTWWTPEEIAVSAAGPAQELLQNLNQEPAVLRDPAEVQPETVLKAMLYGTRTELDGAAADLLERLPRLTRSMDVFLEMSPASAGKWQSLALLLDELGVSPQECLGFGDGGNDVPWLREIGFPVAVANARDEVKAVARMVAGPNDLDGVGEFLQDRLLPLHSH